MGYLNDPRRNVADLTAAAEAERWEEYTQIQSQLAVESTLSALRQAQQAEQAAQNARQEALKQMEERHPGFSERLQSNRESLQTKRPKLAEAISYAENDPRSQEVLLDLYETANDVLREQHSGRAAQHSGRQVDSRVNSLSSSSARQRLIQEFEDKYGDMPVDAADSSENVKLRY